MKKAKLFSLILAALMLAAPVLTACGGGNGGNQTAATTPALTKEEVDVKEVYDQEVKDLKGHDFYFIVQDLGAAHLARNEIYADELTGDKVNDAVFTRNSQIQQKYNCKISEERASNPYDSVREPLIAGEYTYDVIYTKTYDLRRLSGNALLVDFFDLKNIQLDKAWWDAGMIEGLQIRGHLFYLCGDIITTDDRSANIMYYNQDLLDKADLGIDLAQIAREGKWTIDKLYEYSEQLIEDKDGDGVWTPGVDTFAYLCPDYFNGWHIQCFGIYLGNMDSPGNFSLPGTVKKEILAAWDQCRALFTSPHRDVSDAGSRFRNGQDGFYAMNMGSLLNFGNSTVNFGILPMPKLNEEQEKYYTCVSYATHASIGIPITVDQIPEAKEAGFENGAEMIAYFLNAMGYYSRQLLTPAFFDEVLKKQMVQNSETGEMLELALENKFYDPFQIFSFGNIGYIFRDAGSNTKGDVKVGTDTNYDTLVSKYEERLSAARKALNNYLTALDQIEELNG